MLEFIKIGSTFKTHGTKGEIEIDIDETFYDWLMNEKVFFVRIEGNMVPFWIQQVRNDSRIFIKLEEINTPENAKNLTHKEIYADQSKIPRELLEEFDNELSHHTFEGYLLIDSTSKIKVPILQLIEYPSQLMVEVEFKMKKIMIPLHDDFITTLDHKKKKIEVILPEGIFEI